jgi:hypothetical protein
MNKRFTFLFTLLIVFPLILAACGGDDDENDNGGGDVSLGQNFETTQEGVTLSFDYPDEWVSLEQDGAVAIATNDDVADSLTGEGIPEIADEDAGMIFFPFPAALLQLEGDAEELSASAAIDSFSTEFTGEDEFSLGDKSDTTFNGNTAARVTISGDSAEGEIFVVESSEDFFVLGLYITGNYDDDAKARAEAILNTVELTVSE